MKQRDTAILAEVGRIVERGKWLVANAPDTQILRISLMIWRTWTPFGDKTKLPALDELLASEWFARQDPADVVDAYINARSCRTGLELYQRALDNMHHIRGKNEFH